METLSSLTSASLDIVPPWTWPPPFYIFPAQFCFLSFLLLTSHPITFHSGRVQFAEYYGIASALPSTKTQIPISFFFYLSCVCQAKVKHLVKRRYRRKKKRKDLGTLPCSLSLSRHHSHIPKHPLSGVLCDERTPGNQVRLFTRGEEWITGKRVLALEKFSVPGSISTIRMEDDGYKLSYETYETQRHRFPCKCWREQCLDANLCCSTHSNAGSCPWQETFWATWTTWPQPPLLAPFPASTKTMCSKDAE